MFNFFKKKTFSTKMLDKQEASFINVIINKLSVRYPQFKRQLEMETFVGISRDPLGPSGSYTFSLNDNSWQKICDVSKNNFDIQNISFTDNKQRKVIVNIYTMEGLIFGYNTTEDIKNINLSTIDLSNIWEKRFVNNDYSEIESIMSGLDSSELKKLNLAKNTFKIVLNNQEFYALHDISDGNYIAINNKGEVFKLTHDPFVVKKINDSLKELLQGSDLPQ